MKKIIKKILLNLILMAIISFAISMLVYSFKVDFIDYNRNTIIEQKIDSVAQHDYNVIVIGSSTTYRHFNPVIFDSINPSCVSFNAGLPAIRPFRSFDYTEAVLNANDKHYNVVFIELTTFDILGINFDKAIYKNSIDLERYKIALLYPFQVNSGYNNYALSYTKLFFHKYFGFGLANHVALLLGVDPFKNSIPPFYFPVENSVKGYRSADSMMNDTDIRIKEYYCSVREEFLRSGKNDTKILSTEYKALESKEETTENIFTDYYIEFLNRINPKTDELILIIPARTVYNKQLVELKNALIKNNFNVWDYSDPEKYPELYTSETSFDFFHLNGAGADIFTNEIAKRYKKNHNLKE